MGAGFPIVNLCPGSKDAKVLGTCPVCGLREARPHRQQSRSRGGKKEQGAGDR